MAARITESGEGHYEAREVPFGKVYEWHPEHVALECECGEKLILTATSTMTTCSRCGADFRGLVHDIKEREGHLPDRLTPGSTTPKSERNNTSAMRPLILKAHLGVTTILRGPMRRSKPKTTPLQL